MAKIILRSQKNKLYNILSRRVNIQEFDYKETPSQENRHSQIEISHKSEDFYFTIFYVDSEVEIGFDYSSHPTLDSFTEEINTMNFIDILPFFKEWVEIIQEELSIEDLWELDLNSNRLSAERYAAPDKFSEDEQSTARAVIENIKQTIAAEEKFAEVLNQINTKLDVLGDMVSELSKPSWRDLIYGSMTSLVADKIISTTDANEIVSKLFSALEDGLRLLENHL